MSQKSARKARREQNKQNKNNTQTPTGHPEITSPLDLDAAMSTPYAHPFRYPREEPLSPVPTIYREIEWAFGEIAKLLHLPTPATLTMMGEVAETTHAPLMRKALAKGVVSKFPAPYPGISLAQGGQHILAPAPGTLTPICSHFADAILSTLSQDDPTLNRADLAVATYTARELLSVCSDAIKELCDGSHFPKMPTDMEAEALSAAEDAQNASAHLVPALRALYYNCEPDIGEDGYEPLPVIAERGWHLLCFASAFRDRFPDVFASATPPLAR